MVLLRQIDGWISQTREVFERVAASSLAPDCPRGFLLSEPPTGLPSIDVLMVGQPGAGKSALGNRLIDHGDAPLVRGVSLPRDLPVFAEEMVSVARRFPERYSGSQTIPVSEVQAASLPSLPVVLGVRFTEMWGMERSRPASEITGPLIDSHPDRAVLVLVVRADQQLDEPERALLERIAASPWRRSLLVVLNIRAGAEDPEAVIKLKGFVEEQCVAARVEPRGVFAFGVTSGDSPVMEEFERFEDTLSRTLARLWTREHLDELVRVLGRPVREAGRAILEGVGIDPPTQETLAREVEASSREIEEAMEEHDSRRRSAQDAVGVLADRTIDQVASDMGTLRGEELTLKPTERLRTFRREALHSVEQRLGACEVTGGWPVPSLAMAKKPGPGCWPLMAAVLCLLVGAVSAALLQWVLTLVFGGLTLAFVALTVALTVRARRRWYDDTLGRTREVLDSQIAAAHRTIDELHSRDHSPEVLAPEALARRTRLETALFSVETLQSQTERLEDVIRLERGPQAAVERPRSGGPGDHSRRLARALGPGRPLNELFHDNGFDLDAPDLFGRLCEVEYTLRPITHLQSAQTVRQWLRPPLARRQRTIYPFLDRLRIRYDELAPRSRKLVQRILHRSGEDGEAELRLRCKAAPLSGEPPRLAVAEEALERILGRILDEAVKHAFEQRRGGVSMLWSIETAPADERAAVLVLTLHGGRGFDAAGREAFDAGRGGLARFLTDTEQGALGWCSEVRITTHHDGETYRRVLDGSEGRFERVAGEAPEWSTCFTLVFPAVIEEASSG